MLGILTIGTELLTGFIDDTNSSWLGRELTTAGLSPKIKISVSDGVADIVKAIESFPDDVTDLIITGGLGPTHDDITLKSISDYLGIELEIDQQYWEFLRERFRRRGREIPEINRNQALVAADQDIIPNPVGSARGTIFKSGKRRIFLLPGVPDEMKAMFTASVLQLLSTASEDMQVKIIRTTGIWESVLAEKLADILERYQDIQVAFLPRMIGVDIRLISSDTARIEALKQALVNKCGPYFYGFDETGLEEVVGERLVEKGLTIATAESCTGGLISHRLTETPGSSRYHLGSVVAYSNAVKMKQLGVNQDTLATHGAVSEATALEMAGGVRQALGADVGIATTGIAGPDGGTAEKPVGTVYIGYDDGDTRRANRYQFHFNRYWNKRISSQVALNMIRLELENA